MSEKATPGERLVLSGMPGTRRQIADKIGRDLSVVHIHTRNLEAKGLAHVWKIAFGPRGGMPQKVYRTGPAPAKFQPKVQRKLESKERNRRYRRKLMASGEWEDVLVKERNRRWSKAPARRDKLTTAFFGAPG